MKSVLVSMAVVAGCMGWSAPRVAPGPVPLGPPGTRIVRYESKRQSVEHTYTKTFWDEGHGPLDADARVKTITGAIPQALLDRLTMTRQDLDWNGKPFARRVTDGIAVVVSLNPDVLIVSVRESRVLKKGDPIRGAFYDWNQDDGRWQTVAQSLELVGEGYNWLGGITLYAGPLAAWADEMYAYSTDPRIQYQHLTFANGQAIVPLPQGRLVLRRRGVDVDVSRQ